MWKPNKPARSSSFLLFGDQQIAKLAGEIKNQIQMCENERVL